MYLNLCNISAAGVGQIPERGGRRRLFESGSLHTEHDQAGQGHVLEVDLGRTAAPLLPRRRFQ